MRYDVAIIGAGPAGAFCALRLKMLAPNLKICVIDEGDSIEKRTCPAEITGRCMQCRVCAITHGFSGAGAFSDCKLSLYNPEDETFVGGELERFLSAEELKTTIDEVVEQYVKFGAPYQRVGGKSNPIAKKWIQRAKERNLELVTVPFMHTGTKKARKTFFAIQESLMRRNVIFKFNSKAEKVEKNNGFFVVTFNKKIIQAKKVVLATGRAGAQWTKSLCSKLGLEVKEGTIKLGIRYELPNSVMGELNILYEPKFKMPATEETDAALTFCHNPGGRVVSESYDGVITLANGHADDDKTQNTNMALLFKMNLGNNAIETAKKMALKINSVTDGQVMVQRWGDFLLDQPTTVEALTRNSVMPTLLTAKPGNLQLAMNERMIKNLKTFIPSLDNVIQGAANYDNLMYGLEIKFSNLIIKLDENFMTSLEGLYAIGDGSGITNGLIQASCSGWLLAEKILKK